MLNKYADSSFIDCVESDSIYEGANCISNAFSECFQIFGVRNDLTIAVTAYRTNIVRTLNQTALNQSLPNSHTEAVPEARSTSQSASPSDPNLKNETDVGTLSDQQTTDVIAQASMMTADAETGTNRSEFSAEAVQNSTGQRIDFCIRLIMCCN